MTEFDFNQYLQIRSIEKVLGKKVLLSSPMIRSQSLWQSMYRDKAPWLNEEVKSLNLASAISCELARQSTLDFKSAISGSERADIMNRQVYQKIIGDIRRFVEYACACGGVVFKPYLDRDKLAVEYVRANRFYPLSTDSRGEIVSAVFAEQLKREGKIYTRLETHLLERDGITVLNQCFVGSGFLGLGKEISLNKVPEWENLEDMVQLKGADKPLFSYFKMPMANTVDPDSPLGVSAFSRGVDLIREADFQFSRLLWEYEGGELAVDASVDALKQTEGNLKMPRLGKRLFRALDLDMGDSDLYSVFAPRLRDRSYLDGLNEILIRTEDVCGLARGTISNISNAARTATELQLLRQRTNATVTDIQKSLQNALAHLVDGLDMMVSVFGLASAGKVQVTFEFDDSTVTDRAAQFEEMQLLVNRGILNKWEFRSWYFGETEEQAREKLGEIDKETSLQAEESPMA